MLLMIKFSYHLSCSYSPIEIDNTAGLVYLCIDVYFAAQVQLLKILEAFKGCVWLA